jgi:pimeloyl-ACP methyl ester carboxylesterase
MAELADHYREGTGEPLLLVHGFTATWGVWGPMLPSLSESFDVLAPTLAGHVGGPPLDPPRTIAAVADSLERMLDEVGWQEPHVAGFSLGGWMALELGKRGRARSVTAVAPAGAGIWCGPRERKRFQSQFRRNLALTRAILPVADRLFRSPRVRRAALRDIMVHGSRIDRDLTVKTLRDQVAMPVFGELLEAFDREELVDLDRVKVPTHVWWGNQDRILPLRHAPYFEERLPDATFEYVDDAGHVPFWDAPGSVVAAITKTAALAGAPA